LPPATPFARVPGLRGSTASGFSEDEERYLMPMLLCLGMGYSAAVLGHRLRRDGWRVGGTCRSEEKADRLRTAGFDMAVFDGSEPAASLAAMIAEASHLLVSIPPDRVGDAVLRHHVADLRAAPGLQWAGYLSTIGVYGDRHGAWIDENTPPDPLHETSRWRLSAEGEWLGFGKDARLPIAVFRLPGIYGPGRSQFDALREGRAHRIIKTGQVFNRIHVEDLAGILAAAIAKGSEGLYNVADDEPSPAEDVVVLAAAMLGIEPPPEIAFEAAQLSPFARSFYAECKRVRNDRMKDALGVGLRYPTYREGLAAILGAE